MERGAQWTEGASPCPFFKPPRSFCCPECSPWMTQVPLRTPHECGRPTRAWWGGGEGQAADGATWPSLPQPPGGDGSSNKLEELEFRWMKGLVGGGRVRPWRGRWGFLSGRDAEEKRFPFLGKFGARTAEAPQLKCASESPGLGGGRGGGHAHKNVDSDGPTSELLIQ